MPYKKKTHSDVRKCLCLLCFKAHKDLRNIKEMQRENIEKYVVSGLSADDDRLPTVICPTCRLVLHEYSQGSFDRTINLFDHKQLGPLKPITRSSFECTCFMCTFYRDAFRRAAKNENVPRGRPRTATPIPIKVCNMCLSEISRGKEHNCQQNQRIHNILDFIDTSPPKADEKVVSTIVDVHVHVQPEAKELSFTRPQGGKPLTIMTSTQVKNRSNMQPKPSIDFENFQKIKEHQGLSAQKSLNLAKDLRCAFSNRKIITPGLKKKLIDKSHTLDDYYEVKSLSLVAKIAEKKYGKIDAPVVYCVNIEGLVNFVTEERGADDFELKIGVDGGGGFLKICLNILDSGEERYVQSKRARYEDGVASHIFKSSSVRKFIILAIVPGVAETHENMFSIWRLIKFKDTFQHSEVLARFATDLKMANILLGLMSHSCNHPCSWCDVHRTRLHEVGVRHTLTSLQKTFQKWTDAGGKEKEAKHFGNVVHAPLLCGDPCVPVLNILPPPELHLMLGGVNTLYTGLEKVWPDISRWAERCCVEKDEQYGGTFDGNSCRRLLRGTDVLDSMVNLEGKKFVRAFRELDLVVKSCFGEKLESGYEENIFNFKKSYLDLEIPVTPKIHAIFYHVIDFCSTVGDGLGRYSEQASESVHYSFSSEWRNFKVTRSHPEYISRLLRAVNVYNTNHI